MNKEEEYFHKIADRLSEGHRFVKTGKMMSAPGVSYKKKFFAFYYKKEITLKLGKDFVPKEHGIKKLKYLNPFKKKAPMKNWFQFPYFEKKNWEKLAKVALNNLQEDKKSTKKPQTQKDHTNTNKIKFRNIGHVSQSWLNDVGIFTLKDLEKLGAEKAYKKIQDAGHKTTKNLLYSLIGAIHDEDWKVVAETIRHKSKLGSNQTHYNKI